MKIKFLGLIILAVLVTAGCSQNSLTDLSSTDPTSEMVFVEDGRRYTAKWLDPSEVVPATRSGYLVYKDEAQIIDKSVLVVKGTVVDTRYFEITESIGDDDNFPTIFTGILHDVKINEIIYSDKEIKEEVISFASCFPTFFWDARYIDYQPDKEYVFFLETSANGNPAEIAMCDYVMGLPWDSVMIVEDDNLQFSSTWKSLVSEESKPIVREDTMERYSQHVEKLGGEKAEGKLMESEYENAMEKASEFLFDVYMENEEKSIEAIKQLIINHKPIDSVFDAKSDEKS